METPAPVSVGSNASRVPHLPPFLATPASWSHPSPTPAAAANPLALTLLPAPADSPLWTVGWKPPLNPGPVTDLYVLLSYVILPLSLFLSLYFHPLVLSYIHVYMYILYVMCANRLAWTCIFRCRRERLCVRLWLPHWFTVCAGRSERVYEWVRECRWLYRQPGVPSRSIWWTDAPTPSTGRPTRFTKFPLPRRPLLPPTRELHSST